jgi:epoxyqueuosine reductase
VSISQQIKAKAAALGFAQCGIARAEPVDGLAKLRFLKWLEDGFQGGMGYMQRGPEKRIDPRTVLDHARSVISVLINYYSPERHPDDQDTGVISRYAWGRDYHLTVEQKLGELDAFLSSLITGHCSLFYVDTGPVLDKWWAERAGLGWIGKNANLITREMGSWLFVGEILSTHPFEESEYDPPFQHPKGRISTDRGKKRPGADPGDTPAGKDTGKTLCGTCTRCLEICPTRAIVAPYVVDARRCISYLTIELRGPIPREFRSLIGNRIFGCDDCQDVCPWNRFAVPTREEDFRPAEGNLVPRLAELLTMTREEFNHRFKESPIKRARYAGFLRNVAVALGNSHAGEAVPVLVDGLSHPEPLVRQHVAWALGEIGVGEGLKALKTQHQKEDNPDVLEEIAWALRQSGGPQGSAPQAPEISSIWRST